jgi:hypothetical protein
MDHQKTFTEEVPLCNDCTDIAFAGTTQVFTSTFSFQTIPFPLENIIATSEKVVVVPNYNFDSYPILAYSLFIEEEQIELQEDACLTF